MVLDGGAGEEGAGFAVKAAKSEAAVFGVDVYADGVAAGLEGREHLLEDDVALDDTGQPVPAGGAARFHPGPRGAALTSPSRSISVQNAWGLFPSRSKRSLRARTSSTGRPMLEK